MKRIVTLFLLGLLCQTVLAQSDKFSSYESMIGKKAYFYAECMSRISGRFKVYTLENGKYVAITPNQAKRSLGLFSQPADYYFSYGQFDGCYYIDGIVVDKKGKMIKATKDGKTYYFEMNDSNHYISYMRNADQWTSVVSELNNNYNYYVYSLGEKEYVVEVKWEIKSLPDSPEEDVYYLAKAADGKSYIGNIDEYGRTFSYVKLHPEEFLSKDGKIERENKLQSELERKDALSRQGLVLVGRFYNKSIRLIEVRDSLSLFIGLEDDTDGNINLRYLRIEPSKYQAFEQKMSIVNEKFKSWAQTAKEDHVTNFKKKIPVDFENEAGYFSMGFSNKYTYTDLYAVFEVDEKGESRLRIDNWEEYDPGNSSYNSQMHTPYLYFYSPEDFAKFFELMRYDTAVKNYNRVKAIADAANKAVEDRDAKFN